MKTFLALAVLVVAGFAGYSYLTTGALPFIGAEKTAEERQLDELEQRFDSARKQSGQAGRVSALTGSDMTGDVDSARLAVARIEKELEQLRERLTSERARKKATKLASALREYAEELR